MDLDRVPKTLDEAVKMVLDGIPQEERTRLQAEGAQDFATLTHHGLGRWLRNNWSLWDKEMPLHRHFVDVHGIGHPDDMSGLILRCVASDICGYPRNIQDEIAHFHAHWRRMGIDPKTQQPLPGVPKTAGGGLYLVAQDSRGRTRITPAEALVQSLQEEPEDWVDDSELPSVELTDGRDDVNTAVSWVAAGILTLILGSVVLSGLSILVNALRNR